MRLRTYCLMIFCCFVLLAFGLFWVQAVRGSYFYEMSLKNSIRLIPEDAYRGRIVDRNHIVLADNILSFDAVIMPQEVKDKKAVFLELSKLLSKDAKDIARRYERRYLNPFTPVVVAEQIKKTDAIGIEEHSLEYQGIGVEMNSKRSYPYGETAAHILGYIGEIDKSRITRLKDYGYDLKDKVGYSGLEEALDIYLKGDKGGQQIEVDNRGRQVRLLGYKPPSIGRDVSLSIDLELQQIAENLIKGRRGAIVVMDVESGDVVVMNSAPAFDPNVFVDRRDQKSLSYYLTSNDTPLINRAVSGQFPPGSVFKAMTALAAFKNKRFKPSTTYVCRGQLRVGNRDFKCWATHGPQDFYQAMAHSCDVYFYHLGLEAGPDGIAAVAREFGLGSPTGVDLFHEAGGFIPTKMWKRLVKLENWYDGDTANYSIGQGYVLTTPIQLARMMAILANGGHLVVPHLTTAIGDVSIRPKDVKKINMDPSLMDLVRKSLRYPVSFESGTAHALNIAGMNICAKTGTAQVYGQGSHGWVAGFFPSAHPRYAFCILLENAGSSHAAVDVGRVFFEEAKKRGKLI